MSIAFTLWLERMFSSYNTEIVIGKLRLMGWEYLTGGGYKAVYHKKGVPFLIKVTSGDYTNKWDDPDKERGAMMEFEMPNMVRTLPYLAYGYGEHYTPWGTERCGWGIQEKCKDILRNFTIRYTNKRVNRIREMFDSNPDSHTSNIGLTYCGRWVQFD